MAAAAARTAALRPPTAPAGANDAAPPPVPGNGEGGGKATSPGPARRRRPRPWDDLNETSFRSALTDDLGLELEIEEDPEGDPYYDVEGGTGLARGQQRTQAQTQPVMTPLRPEKGVPARASLLSSYVGMYTSAIGTTPASAGGPPGT